MILFFWGLFVEQTAKINISRKHRVIKSTNENGNITTFIQHHKYAFSFSFNNNFVQKLKD